MRWYVVQVVSGQEKKVKKTLEESLSSKGLAGQIEEILIPTEHVSEVKRGKQTISEKKMWPGYIMVKMVFSDESWAYLINTPGVLGFPGGDKPHPLSDKEVGELLQQIEERKSGPVAKHKVDVGDRVKITDGVFVNFTGTVMEVNHDKGRISVLVSIFGRDTRVDDLEFWQVEQISNESAS
jgi:transcriptional antiterminator NusG